MLKYLLLPILLFGRSISKPKIGTCYHYSRGLTQVYMEITKVQDYGFYAHAYEQSLNEKPIPYTKYITYINYKEFGAEQVDCSIMELLK